MVIRHGRLLILVMRVPGLNRTFKIVHPPRRMDKIMFLKDALMKLKQIKKS